jgi:parallel beta-helix repeat protein
MGRSSCATTLPQIKAPTSKKCFGGSGTVTFGAASCMERAYPEWWGAVGDGAADDTTAFNGASGALGNMGGGRLICAAGRNYLIDPNQNAGKSIRLASKTTLELRNGCTLQAKTNGLASSAVVYCFNVTDVAVIGPGQIIGDRATHAGVPGTDVGFGIMFLKCTRFTVRGPYIKNCQGDGIYIGSNTSVAGDESLDGVIDGVTCDNNRRQGMSVVSAKRVRTTGSSFINTNGNAPSAGIDFEPDVGTAVVQDCTVNGCTFENNVIGVAFAGASQQITVSGSTFRSNTSEGILFGISCVDCIASNNTVIQNGALQIGIYMAFCQGATAIGNIVRGTFEEGIWARGGGSYATIGRNRIEGNRIIGDGVTVSKGIYVTNLSGRNDIIGNEVRSCGTGIWLTASDWQILKGNFVSSCFLHGIQLDGTIQFLVCEGNISEGNTFQGFHISAVSRSTFTANIAQGNGTDGFQTSGGGSDNLFVGNMAIGNSQTTSATSDNFSINTDKNLLEGNMARVGAGPNLPRYGIFVGGGTGNRVWWNDCEGGGTTGEIRDIATATKHYGDRGTGQVSADRGDAPQSLARGDAEIQRWDTTLTADRICTLPGLSGTTSYAGMHYRIRRLAGAFNLIVKDTGGTVIKSVPANSWVDVTVNDANNAWLETGFGAL